MDDTTAEQYANQSIWERVSPDECTEMLADLSMVIEAGIDPVLLRQTMTEQETSDPDFRWNRQAVLFALDLAAIKQLAVDWRDGKRGEPAWQHSQYFDAAMIRVLIESGNEDDEEQP